MSTRLRNLAIAVVASSFLGAIPAAAKNYDLVILNGRVMDPESGLDAVRSPGLVGDAEPALLFPRQEKMRVLHAERTEDVLVEIVGQRLAGDHLARGVTGVDRRDPETSHPFDEPLYFCDRHRHHWVPDGVGGWAHIHEYDLGRPNYSAPILSNQGEFEIFMNHDAHSAEYPPGSRR